MIARIVALSASTVAMAVLATLALRGVAAHDRVAVATTQELVRAGAARVETDLVDQSLAMVGAARAAAQEAGLAADLRALALAFNQAAGRSPPERLQARIDFQSAKLIDREAAREERTAAERAAFSMQTFGLRR